MSQPTEPKEPIPEQPDRSLAGESPAGEKPAGRPLRRRLAGAGLSPEEQALLSGEAPAPPPDPGLTPEEEAAAGPDVTLEERAAPEAQPEPEEIRAEPPVEIVETPLETPPAPPERSSGRGPSFWQFGGKSDRRARSRAVDAGGFRW